MAIAIVVVAVVLVVAIHGPGGTHDLEPNLDIRIVDLTPNIVFACRFVDAGEEAGHVNDPPVLGDGQACWVVRVSNVRQDVCEGSLHWVERGRRRSREG